MKVTLRKTRLRGSILLVLTVLLGAVLFGAVLAPAGAQSAPDGVQSDGVEVASDQQEVADEVFTDIIDVRVVDIFVYVRDKDGKPVTGLGPDDFAIFEDGKPVPITNFYEVSDGRRLDAEEDDRSQLEKLLANPDYDPRLDDTPEDQRLHLIVYVDHQNIRPYNRNRVFRFVREFLHQNVDRQDRVMLASYNRSLKIERPFTSDPKIISNALFELEEHTGGRVQVDSERRDLLREVQETRQPAMLEARIRLFAENQFNDLRFTVDALKDLVNSLGGVPGRKALLYVSDGLPMRAGEDLFVAAAETYPEELSGLRLEAMQYDASRDYQLLADAASANQIAFYTLDAAGLGGRSDRGADVGSFHAEATSSGIWEDNMQQSLMFLADETGGQFIVNTNNFADGLANFAVDFKHYYSLGYTPGHAGTGRRYDIKVRCLPKQVKECRHREVYQDKPIEAEMEAITLASITFGFQQNPMGILIKPTESTPPIRRSDGTYMVHIDVRIPIGELVLLPRADGKHVAKVRLWVQAADDKGRLSDPVLVPVDIEVPEEDLEMAKDQYFVRELPLLMRAGEQRVAFALRDDLGARESFVSRVFSVGSE